MLYEKIIINKSTPLSEDDSKEGAILASNAPDLSTIRAKMKIGSARTVSEELEPWVLPSAHRKIREPKLQLRSIYGWGNIS